jgi:fibronectin-binding autotransporter adhesin
VLTKDIVVANSCVDTLTLTGVSIADNEISGSIPDSPSGLNVIKNGSGKWILSGLNTYSGQLRVLDGTLVVADVVDDFSGPFGGNPNILPQVGSDGAGLTGRAALLSEGFTVDRSFSVAALGAGSTQEVVLGAVGSGTARFPSGQAIQLGRDVTLQASTGGVAVFANSWRNLDGGNDPNVAFTVGSPGNTGTVVFASNLPVSITGVYVVEGTARLQGSERIRFGTPVTLGSAGASGTLDLDSYEQTLESLTMQGSATVAGGLLLTQDVIVASNSGNQIFSNVNLDATTTANVSGSLMISGDVSGSSDLVKTGSGTLSLTGSLGYTGETNINAGTLEVESLVSGPPKVLSSTFTPTTLVVQFTDTPLTGEQYRLLPGSTTQAYSSVILNNAGGATGTYDSITSTLTIN